MIIEISVALIAFILLVLMICAIPLLLKTRKTLENIDSLLSDLKSKSDSLDFVFRPLKSIGKGKQGRASDTVSEIVDWVSASLTLFNKIKHAVKHREK